MSDNYTSIVDGYPYTPKTADRIGAYGFGYDTTEEKHAMFITNSLPEGGLSHCSTDGAALSPLHAKKIDIKIDDGNGITGNAIGYKGYYGGESFNGECLTASDYDLSVNSISCGLEYFSPLL